MIVDWVIIKDLLTMSVPILVALLYIRHQKNTDQKRRLNEQIHQTYIEQGILQMQALLSNYGISTVFAIADMRSQAIKSFKHGEGKAYFNTILLEIRQRPTVNRLLDRRFKEILDCTPYLRRFGRVIYSSIIRTIQYYSNLLNDILNDSIIVPQIEDGGIDNFAESSKNLARILEDTQLFLQERLDNLKEYILEKNYESFTDFTNSLNDKKYKLFLTNFKHYNDLFSDFSKAMTGPSNERRAVTSEKLSKWLEENNGKNPFTIDRVHERVS